MIPAPVVPYKTVGMWRETLNEFDLKEEDVQRPKYKIDFVKTNKILQG